MRNTKRIFVIALCAILGMVLTVNLAGCSLFAPKQSLEGIWVKKVNEGQFTILTIDEELLRAFYINTDEAITEENAVVLLSGNPAYFYSYTKTDASITLKELDKADGEVEYGMVLSEGLLELNVNGDTFFLNGQYIYVSAPIEEDISATNANDTLVQEYMNGIWIKQGSYDDNILDGYSSYTILSVNPASYSNVFFINTTLNLETGVFPNDLGFKGSLFDDATIDGFFDFVVQNNRSLSVAYADGAEPDAIVSESIYNVTITNGGILLASQNTAKGVLDGFYYKSREVSTFTEGVWAQPFSVSRYGEPGCLFEIIQNGNVSTGEAIFVEGDIVDHDQLLEYYNNDGSKGREYPYQLFDDGQIMFSGVCYWPVHITDRLSIFGASGSPDVWPAYWVPMYHLV